MAVEKSKTMYNGDWNVWESAMKGPIGKAKALQLIFPTIQGVGEAEEVVPRLERPLILANPRAAGAKTTIKAAEKWDEANQACITAIYENLPPRYNYLLNPPRAIASELWDHLKSKLFVRDGPSRAAVRSKFINCLQGPNTSLDTHCDNFLRYLDACASIGVAVNPADAYLQLVESIDRT